MHLRIALLPGLHGTADLFDPFLAHAPPCESMRIITYPPDRCLGWPALHEHIAAELHAERNLVLIAESFGGPLALRFAVDHPECVRAVVLCASFVRPPVPRMLCFLATPLIMSFFPIPAVGIRVFLSGMRAEAGLVRQVRGAIAANSPRVLAHRVRLAAWTDARDALRKCRAPILYLAAKRDRLIGARGLRRVQKIRPSVQMHLMDTPHLLLQSRPKEAWQPIQRFLNEILVPAPDNPAPKAAS